MARRQDTLHPFSTYSRVCFAGGFFSRERAKDAFEIKNDSVAQYKAARTATATGPCSKSVKRLLAPALTRSSPDRCVMSVLFATFRGEIFGAEFRALRFFVRRRLAGVAIADLLWHGEMSTRCRRLPTSL
jgi:hypothetical protein